VLDVLANDRDPDGDALRIVSAVSAEFGPALTVANGVLVLDAAPFTAGAIRYVATDGHGHFVTATATVTVTVAPPAPTLSGGAGAETLTGGSGRDAIDAGGGADTLNGQRGDDWLAGGAGDDLLTGHLGSDLALGGAGADTFRFSRALTQAGDADRVLDLDFAGGDALHLLHWGAGTFAPARFDAVAGGGASATIRSLADLLDLDAAPGFDLAFTGSTAADAMSFRLATPGGGTIDLHLAGVGAAELALLGYIV
jgi:Ca2+-binding RTX toxin-like protein